MGINTTILGLYKPDIDEVGWGGLRNAAYDIIDTALGTQHGLTGQHKFVTVDSGTGYITFPTLTTVQRNALPATNGMTIYNTTTNTLQSYQNGSWQNVIVNSITVEEQDFGPSISNASTIRFPNGTVTDLGGGIASIAGFLQDAEGVAVGDVIYFDGSNWSRVAPGSSGQVFQTNGVGFAPTWVNPTSGGNVSAALSLTDNRIVRGDGGAAGVQTSGVTIDDSNNVTGIVALTTTGTVTHNGVTYTFPAADGSSGQFLRTNGAGVLTWATSSGAGNVSTTTIADNVLVRGDGGAQDIQGSGITISDTNDITGVVNFTNTGTVTHNTVTYTFPAADGTSGFQLTTNGAGTLSWAASGGGGSGSSLTRAINQVGHGFAVGDWIRLNTTTYVDAQADSAVNAEVVGVVSAVAGVDDFTFTYSGLVTGLSGLTAGAGYFLSAATPAAITATAPVTVGNIVKPVLIADTTTSGYVFNMRGNEVLASTPTVSSYRDSFVDGDLTAGVLTVTHSLSQKYVSVSVYNNNDDLIIPDDVTVINTTSLTIDLTGFGTLTGTWNLVVLA